ncbi:MAG TPA: TonB-dependent receptor [Woeseiaceae bacterium]|nr:TonB-dependent receptor [Woeseiaceae bacterium]
MRCLPRFAWVPVLTCCLNFCLAADAVWQGRPVSEFLDSLNQQGYQIIFSRDVVTDDLLILHEPESNDSIAAARIVVEAHELSLERGPSGSWLVRQKSPPAAEAAAIRAAAEVPLPEIIVTSSLHRLEYVQTGTPTYLDRQLASRVPTTGDEVTRITTRLPGTANGGISSRSHVRGGESNEVLFLLDGHRLYEPFHLKDFQAVATIVNSNAIDGIDYYTGAYPARYGDRMSGVMNLSLRQPEKPVQTELALSFFNTSVLSLGTIRGGGDWLFAARRGNLDIIADTVNPDVGSPDYQDFLMHVGWDFGPRMQFGANVLYSKDKLTLADTGRGERANANYENQVAWLSWKADWTERLSSETALSIGAIMGRRTGTLDLPQVVNGTLDEYRDFDSVGLRQDWTLIPSKTWMLSFGIEGKHQDAKYRFSSTKTISPPFDSILDNALLTVIDFDSQPEGAQYNAYVEARWQLRNNLVVDAGIRWDTQSYTMAMNDKQTSPRLSVLYRINSRSELRVGWGQFSQAQESNELQVSDGIDSFFPAQRAEHVVANFKHRLGRDANIDVSYYRKSFRAVRPRFENAFNALTLLPELQFDRYRIDPLSGLAQGAELMLSEGDSSQDLFWWIGYAWSEVTDTTATRRVRRSWDQTHTLKAGLSLRWGSWNISAAGEVHTGWPRTGLVDYSPVSVTVSEPNASRYSVFHTIDARVSRGFPLPRGDLEVFLEVSNIYNRRNPCCTEYSIVSSANGPELVASEEHWLPLVPSLGIVWRF